MGKLAMEKCLKHARCGTLLLTALILHPIKVHSAPTCTLTPSRSLYSGAPQYGGYTTSAGFSVTASCSGSGAITYLWTVVSAPITPTLANAATATVAVTANTLFGDYKLNLAATDTMGTTNTTIDIGSVPKNVDGSVNLTLALGATSGPKVEKLIGPLTPVGSNSSPRYDNRNQAALDAGWSFYGAGQPYGPYWRTYQTGTITLTGGSAVVVGSGTSMKTWFCAGSSSPTARNQIWFRYTGRDSVLSWTRRQVLSCTDETHITLSIEYPLNSASWGQLPNCDAGCAGLSWGGENIDGGATQFSLMEYGNACRNYYDAWGVAAYSFYLRSGLTVYLTEFRTWMDDQWQNPDTDRGTSQELFAQNYDASLGSPRTVSLLGLVLRALDLSAQVDNTMWPGLRIAWARYKYYLTNYIPANGRIDDTRDDAYEIAMVAECAIAEIDSSQATSCKAAISTVTPYLDTYKTIVGSGITFNQIYLGLGNGGSSSTALSGAGTRTITVVNGSASATLNGATANSSGEPNVYLWLWADIPSVFPANATGSHADATYYHITATGSNAVTLDRAYEGTSGTKGYVFGNVFAGWGSQTFMEGLMGEALYMASLSIDGYDNTNRDKLRGFVIGIANWLRDYGYNITSTGLYSGVFQVCGHPIPATDSMCGTNGGGVSDSVFARRLLNALVVRAAGLGYRLSGDTTLRTFTDKIYSEIWDKPGTNGLTSDASYVAEWDDGQFLIAAAGGGAYSSTTGPKWLGEDFGFPQPASWAILRSPVIIGTRQFSGMRVPLGSASPTSSVYGSIGMFGAGGNVGLYGVH